MALLPPASLRVAVQVSGWTPQGLSNTEANVQSGRLASLVPARRIPGPPRAADRGDVQRHPAAVAPALAGAGIGLWARLAEHSLIGGTGIGFAPLRLLRALSSAYLVAVWMRGRVAGALAAIGRSSLQMFC